MMLTILESLNQDYMKNYYNLTTADGDDNGGEMAESYEEGDIIKGKSIHFTCRLL